MASEISENVAVGEVISYGRVYNPFSKKARVTVKANDRIIRVPVDYRQQRYIQNEHPIGDRVAVGFYGGEWHIGSPPATSSDYGPEQDISDLDLLQYELNSLDLLELVGRPFRVPDAEPLQEGEPDNAVEGEEIETLKQKAVINLMLSEIDEHRDYIQQIEQDVRKNSDLILEGFGQPGDREAVPAKPLLEGEPHYARDGKDIETLKEKAVINLLLSDIDEHRDYLQQVEQDVRKNSDLILEDLGLSHLKKSNQMKKLKQTIAREEIKTIDKINLEYNTRLDLIIIQNNEIISKLDEIIYLLKEKMAR